MSSARRVAWLRPLPATFGPAAIATAVKKQWLIEPRPHSDATSPPNLRRRHVFSKRCGMGFQPVPMSLGRRGKFVMTTRFKSNNTAIVGLISWHSIKSSAATVWETAPLGQPRLADPIN